MATVIVIDPGVVLRMVINQAMTVNDTPNLVILGPHEEEPAVGITAWARVYLPAIAERASNRTENTAEIADMHVAIGCKVRASEVEDSQAALLSILAIIRKAFKGQTFKDAGTNHRADCYKATAEPDTQPDDLAEFATGQVMIEGTVTRSSGNSLVSFPA